MTTSGGTRERIGRMHLLTALSLKNRALIALVTIVAAVFGLLGVSSLKQELMPSVQFPAIAVVTTYPGASPEVVNNDVSGPIETALRGVPQLESSTATSSTGASMVVAQFTYGVDLAATEQKVERAVSRISQILPDAADTQVVSGSIDDFPVIQIAVTPAEGETPEQAAQLMERVAIPELSELDGVRDAQLTGARADQVTIVPNMEALAGQGLSSQAIVDTLQQSGVLIAAGTITDGDQTLAVQAGSEVQTPEDIAALPLALSPEQLAAQQQALLEQQTPPGPGTAPVAEAPTAPIVVTIGEVAEVRLEPSPVQSISRVDGAPALTIAVTKTSAANTVDVSQAVQSTLADLKDQLGGAKLNIIFDQAPYIEHSIETLTVEGLLGLVFAVLVILVFLMSIRATLVTAISIPTSVLLTFIGLNFADYTLNMLTLGALTISIGRVVDDSIVVIENIKRHLVSDDDKAATIVRAVREVAGAITASTITTVAVFLPMAFVAGMVGELFRPFAFTVTISLAASLLVSLTIVPVLAYWFLRPDRSRRRATATGEVAEPVTALQRWYRPVIDWTLRKPGITLMIAALVFGGTIATTPFMKTNFMGADEQNSVGLVQTLKPGTSIDAQLAQAERVEEVLADVPEVESIQVTIGNAGGGMAAIFGGGGDGALSYSLTTDPDANQEKAQDAIRAAVAKLDEAGEFSLGQSGGGVTMSSAIEVSVTAPDQATLQEASEAVVTALKKQDGLKQVESDLGMSRPYLKVTVDRGLAAAAGLTEAGVAGQVAQHMQPRQIGQITRDAESTSVYLSDGTAPTDQTGVAALLVQTAVGPQRLDTLATIEVADGPVTVRTEDGARMVTVSALPEGDDLGTASVAVDQALESVKLPAGASATIGGVMAQQSEAFEQLGIALLAAILIVYVVMVATFRSLLQPLLLLISVPFAATGAILLLIATGIPLGVASLIGVLMLIGIVVTNAIVLIDLVNQYRERGDALKDAVTHGALQRLRPIVMTALATILALTPMALGITGKGGFISQPLAVVVIGGLLSSTVLTLVVLPTLYFAVERRREGGSGRKARRHSGGDTDDSDLVLAGSGLLAAGDAAAANSGFGAGARIAGTGPIRTGGAGPVRASAVPLNGETAGPAAAEPPLDAEAEPAGSEVVEPELPWDADLEPELDATPVGHMESAPDLPWDADPVEAETDITVEATATQVASAQSEPVAGPVADAATQHSILEQLMRAGLDAPETSERRTEPASPDAPAHVAHPAPRPAFDANPAAPVAAAGIVLPEPTHAEQHATEMGPETKQMSLDLSDLGFTGNDNPLTVEEADSAGSATSNEGADEGHSAEISEAEALNPGTDTIAVDTAAIDAAAEARARRDGDARRMAEFADSANPAVGLVPLMLPGPDGLAPGEAKPAADPRAADDLDPQHSALTETEPSVPADPDPEVLADLEGDSSGFRKPVVESPAPPVTGELNWEQLLWQATQEVEDEEVAPAADPEATATDEGAEDAPGPRRAGRPSDEDK